jgi:uncharacterized integral membrane protein (TIGR00697 family)
VAVTAAPTRSFVVTRVAIVAVGAYVGAQLIADVASIKIGTVFDRAVDMGTFIYPITFTLRDVVHKTLGKSAARTVVVTAAGVNLFMAAYLSFAASFTPDSSFGIDAEFRTVLGPLWRIVLASILAEVISQLVDTEAYHWFVTKVTRRHQWARVVVSNGIALPIDSAIFVVAAFGAIPFMGDHALTLPWADVWDIFVVNVVVKGVVTLLSVPLIYLTPDRWAPATADDL